MDGTDENTPLVQRVLSRVEPNGQSKPLYEDERAWVRWPSAFLHKTWQVLASNYVNVLLVFVPVGIILGALDIDPTAIFVINFLAIIPLASLLSFATEELSVKLGQTVGGLLNATFGNAVELIVCLELCALTASANVTIRYRLLPSVKARSALSSPVCLVASSPTSCSCLAAASSLVAGIALNRPSIRL